jgi:hypothetical protein
MKLDTARSRLAIFTFAEGLFSALAHDLELVAGDLTGEATESTAELRVPVAAIRVSGVVKRGKTDASVLSSSDRSTIEAQLRDNVLPTAEIVASGTLEGARAAIVVKGPRTTAHVTASVAVTRETDATRVKGRVEVSLAALGCTPVKGPMGAFRVSDRVRVEIDLLFV